MIKTLRILIADDHEIVRRGMRPIIESEWGWEICGEASDGREALALAIKLKPDVVVLDVGMPEMNGVDLTREIKRELPDTEVLAFTGTESESLLHQLFASGASGCVLKTEAGEHLIPAIKAIAQHEPYLGSRVSKIVFASYLKGGMQGEETCPGGLTPREREIVQLLCEGKSNKEVATMLGTATKTVETQRAAIMRKLKLEAFSQLVRWAVRSGITPS